MKAFEFDHRLIDAYARFSRSFSTIRSDDLKSEVDRQYDAGRFWPNAMLSLNPKFLQGPTVDDLVASGDLDEATGRIFRFGSEPLRFHRHQAQSIAKAQAGLQDPDGRGKVHVASVRACGRGLVSIALRSVRVWHGRKTVCGVLRHCSIRQTIRFPRR